MIPRCPTARRGPSFWKRQKAPGIVRASSTRRRPSQLSSSKKKRKTFDTPAGPARSPFPLSREASCTYVRTSPVFRPRGATGLVMCREFASSGTDPSPSPRIRWCDVRAAQGFAQRNGTYVVTCTYAWTRGVIHLSSDQDVLAWVGHSSRSRCAGLPFVNPI